MRYPIFITAILVIATLGCAGGSSVLQPPTSPVTSQNAVSDSHQIWGLWQFTADPVAGSLECVPLRTASMHVNLVTILEPPAGAKLKISNLSFNGLICDVDVTLVHPFPGLSQYIGFDVAGIFISKGTLTGWSDPNLVMAGPSETRLLNPDGYTRWWNPAEFAVAGPPILRYKDGLLGNKNSNAHFNCTLNGYKLFGDDLSKEADLLSLSPTNRLSFKDGSSNTRHYQIDFTGGVVFNYAVDANWELPTGTPPFTPDVYAPSANRPEAWACSISEVENTLYNEGADKGGSLKLKIDLWDHYNAGLNALTVESPGNFDPVTVTTSNIGDGVATFDVDIPSATPKAGSIDLLLSAESEASGYADVLPNNKVTAYFTHTSLVGTVGQFAPDALLVATTSTEITTGGTVSFDASASTGTPPLTFAWDFDGDNIYDEPTDDAYTGASDKPTHTFSNNGTFKVTVKVTNIKGWDISDPVTVKVGFDADDTYVDADYTGNDSDGTQAKPFKTIQEGEAAVLANHKVHVDYWDGGSSNTYDTANLSLKSNTTLLGDNWNGGGPGKPKLDNSAQFYVVGASYTGLSNFTLDGFQMTVGGIPGVYEHFGAYFLNCSNITVRHCHITGYADDTGLSDGDLDPIYLSNCPNAVIEFNEIGPITWHSDTGGEYATVALCIASYENNNIEISNNYIHDITMDYSGGGNIRVFGVYLQCSQVANVHNNLVCHFYANPGYSYTFWGLLGENLAFTTNNHHFYNNTVDALDISQASWGSIYGMYLTSMDQEAPGSYCNNTILTNFTGGNISAYIGTAAYNYPLTYCTGYKLGSITSYFSSWLMGDGNVDYPGVDPKYVNGTTAPYDYTFQAGTDCEKGDPNFIDWDDTGAPSGNPNEPDLQNRSRMGCFGGPDGNWDPNNL